MQAAIVQGLDSESEKDIRGSYAASLLIRKRYQELITSKIENSMAMSCTKTGYESPNWAYEQADARGYERAMREVKRLLD